MVTYKTCPRCGTDYSLNSTYCAKCGSGLKPGTKIQPTRYNILRFFRLLIGVWVVTSLILLILITIAAIQTDSAEVISVDQFLLFFIILLLFSFIIAFFVSFFGISMIYSWVKAEEWEVGGGD